LYVGIASNFLAPYLYRRAYRRRYGDETHTNILTFGEYKIECLCVGRSHSTIEWTVVKSVLQSETTILLYTGPKVFMYVPRRVVSAEEYAEFRDILRYVGHEIRSTGRRSVETNMDSDIRTT
jgi:hypothetical protein